MKMACKLRRCMRPWIIERTNAWLGVIPTIARSS